MTLVIIIGRLVLLGSIKDTYFSTCHPFYMSLCLEKHFQLELIFGFGKKIKYFNRWKIYILNIPLPLATTLNKSA